MAKNNLDAIGERLTQLAELQERSHKNFMEELDKSDVKSLKKWEKLGTSQEETDRLLKKISKMMEELGKSDEESLKKWEKLRTSQEETDRLLKKISKMFGDSGNVDGEIAEEIFFTSLEDSLQLGDIQFDRIYRNVRPIGGTGPEFDIVLVNGTTIGIIEVKKKAHPDQVQDLSLRQTQQFRITQPQYSNHKIYFGIASLVTNTELIDESKKAGIFLLTQKGKHVEMVNTQVKEF